MEAYKIQFGTFEGPMELLLHLIEKNQIDVYDIPVAVLTRQYMAYLQEMRQFDIEVASEFLVMAATLLLIKSRMMLPKAPQVEEEAEEDPRQELVARILAYQQYKKVSVVLDEWAQRQSRHVTRPPMALPVRRLPPENLSVETLWNAFQRLLARRRELTIPEVIVAHETYRVEEQMAKIMEQLAAQGGVLPFFAVFAEGTRAALIAGFLALLELIRRKYIFAEQSALFSSIVLRVKPLAPAFDEGKGTEDGTDVFA
ncbi:MAG: segregation and condensation protein A [Schwartzia sp. (in: firmicutes)]